MHRNTKTLLVVLGLIAMLLTGINIGRSNLVSPARVSISPTPAPQATPGPKTHTLSECGISFTIPDDFVVQEASGGAKVSSTKTSQAINIGCLAEIPRPPLPKERTEEITVAGQKTTLYHDASAKDGAAQDMVVLRQEKKALDVAILGFGESYKKLIESIQFTP